MMLEQNQRKINKMKELKNQYYLQYGSFGEKRTNISADEEEISQKSLTENKIDFKSYLNTNF